MLLNVVLLEGVNIQQDCRYLLQVIYRWSTDGLFSIHMFWSAKKWLNFNADYGISFSEPRDFTENSESEVT